MVVGEKKKVATAKQQSSFLSEALGFLYYMVPPTHDNYMPVGIHAVHLTPEKIVIVYSSLLLFCTCRVCNMSL